MCSNFISRPGAPLQLGELNKSKNDGSFNSLIVNPQRLRNLPIIFIKVKGLNCDKELCSLGGYSLFEVN